LKKLYLRVDVFHHLELSTRSVDLGACAGLDLVHEFAKNLAIPDDIFEGLTSREFPAKDGLNPFLGFLLLLGVALGSNLNNIDTCFIV